MELPTPAGEGAGSLHRAAALADLRAGLKQGLLLGAALAALVLPTARPMAHSGARLTAGVALVPQRQVTHAVFAGTNPSPDARELAEWVAFSGDNGGTPFAILDKRAARLFVFDPDARLLSSSLVLLGSAVGDDSAPDIGDRPLAQLGSHERTTAAGRFVSQPGRDDTGERVVWVDYASALALHRVKVVDPKERRFERIATDSITDKRISNGCINVPIAFFDDVVEPALGRARAVVYVLPEVKPLHQVFPRVAARPPAS